MTHRPAETVALVPLRALGIGKSRLANVLSAEERGALAGAMLADVIATLASTAVARVVVAAAGPTAAAVAVANGAEVVLDPPWIADRPVSRQLDAAVRTAVRRLGGRAGVLVVAGDLPHLQTVDVETLLQADAEVVVAPTWDGGTGGLLRRRPAACPTAYGPGSADRHLRLARRAGLVALRCERVGFAHDLDDESDLSRSRHGRRLPPLGRRTATLLADVGFGATGGFRGAWLSRLELRS